jgi:hypothetical protein
MEVSMQRLRLLRRSSSFSSLAFSVQAFVVFFLTCSAFAQNPSVMPQLHPACGAMNAQFQVKMDDAQLPDPQVEAGKALIYVVEDQKYKAVRDVTIRIGLDGEWVGATRGNSYLFFPVEPGEHHLCADWTSDFLPSDRLVSLFGLTVESGKTYYFRARTTGGPGSLTERNGQGDTASLDLDLVNSDEGKYLVTFSPLSVSHPKK